MKRVFICSRFRGNRQANLEATKRYCKRAVEQGHAPYAPHLLYPQFLEDGVTTERDTGIQAGFEFLKVCDEVWVHTSDGTLSEGMKLEVELALEEGIPLFWFATAKDGLIVELLHLPTDQMPKKADLLLPQEFTQQVNKAFKGLESLLMSDDLPDEELDAEIDKILGIDTPNRDRDMEQEWERIRLGGSLETEMDDPKFLGDK